MRRTGPLLALAVVLVAVGAAAIAWMAGATGSGSAPRAQLTAAPLDPGPALAALERRAATLAAAATAIDGGQLDALLAQDPLTLELDELSRGGVTLRDVAVRRTGPDAAGEATVDEAQLAALAPGGVELGFDADASAAAGDAIVLSGSTDALLGLEVPVSVRVRAVDGAVVAEPDGLPVGELVLFDDPRVRVTSLSAEPLGGGLLRVRAAAQVG